MDYICRSKKYLLNNSEVMMENIQKAIEVINKLDNKYELSCENIQAIREQYDDFKVYIPLIGRFSAGKSALINNLLGWNTEVCRENIGIATAIPTEVFAGEADQACICHPEKEFISMEEYMERREEITAANAEVMKLQLSGNEVLDRFPSVAIVDMPGLDSGYEVHDKAIDYYIKKSMSYILVFPADELTIPKSMEPILMDLNSYNMPMCVVITKGNRILGVEEQRKRDLRSSLTQYFKNTDFPIFITEKETGKVDELVNYLVSIEHKAGDLGKAYYKKKLEPEFSRITNYLLGYIKNMEMSLSELEEEKDKLNSDIQKLNATVDTELLAFDRQIPVLINDIAGDVQAALSNRMDEFVSDLIHDTDVSRSINETVRTTLVSSYQTRVMGKLQKQLDKISSAMSLGSSNYASSLAIDMDKVCGKEISGIGRTAIDAIALIFGPVAAVIAHLLTGQWNKNINEKRREAEMKVKQQLSASVFPAVDKEVRDKLEMDLKKMSLEVRQNVEKDMAVQMESLMKALDEVTKKKNEEDVLKDNERMEINNDLKIIEDIHRIIG